jgi:limonene-1,2-epoxide hydrolase
MQMRPKERVQHWVDAFNRRDAEKIATLHYDDAVNHQAVQDPVQGREAIRAMFESDFATAEMVCIVANLFEDGNLAIREWRDPLGLRGCGCFPIRDGRIALQRRYGDKLSFLKFHGLPVA